MRWQRSEKADRNFRDARTGGNPRAGGGRGGAAVGAGGLGIIGLILALLFGGSIFGSGSGTASGSALDSVGGAQAPRTSASTGALADESAEWFNFLLSDVQDFWVDKFAENNIRYEPATLTLFDTPIRTGCGTAQAAIGPHYCPLDKGIYLETGFFDAILARRFGAGGDFAQAYVVAHEFGHHVQNELGISTWVRQQQQLNPSQRNDFSVRLELQADCLAGVWARYAEERGLLDRTDIPEALEAAAAVGDDRIQQSSGQRVNPHSWTHGSSAQRQEWFERGLNTFDTESCDTFGVQ